MSLSSLLKTFKILEEELILKGLKKQLDIQEIMDQRKCRVGFNILYYNKHYESEKLIGDIPIFVHITIKKGQDCYLNIRTIAPSRKQSFILKKHINLITEHQSINKILNFVDIYLGFDSYSLSQYKEHLKLNEISEVEIWTQNF